MEEFKYYEISDAIRRANYFRRLSALFVQDRTSSSLRMEDNPVDLSSLKNIKSCEILPEKSNLTSTEFGTSGNYGNRVPSCTKELKCEFCDKRFKFMSRLKTHTRIHTGEKPFQCDICYKKFGDANNFKRHRRIHTGEKPFKCELCEITFARSSTLVFHKRTHTGEKPYQCEMCKRSFRESRTLKRHERIHSHQRVKCEKQFTTSSSPPSSVYSNCTSTNAGLVNITGVTDV